MSPREGQENPDELPAAPKKSPYLSLYLTRNQVEAIRKTLAGEPAPKRDVDAALRWIREALDA